MFEVIVNPDVPGSVSLEMINGSFPIPRFKYLQIDLSKKKNKKYLKTNVVKEEEIVGEDRISELPDSVIAHILSLLSSTKEAIKTSVLSKRWQYLWTSVPVLIIPESKHHHNNYYNRRIFSSVERTLACRGDNKLQKFAFLTDKWHQGLDSSHVSHWISYAIRCNVEELEISCHCSLPNLPEFQNSCLKKLRLDYCIILYLIGEINFENLTSLCLAHGEVTCKSISKLLSGSPSLETLELAYCRGRDGLNITSTGLRKLIVNDHWSRLEIKAPNLLSLEIKGNIYSEITLMDVGSVVEATLDFDTSSMMMLLDFDTSSMMMLKRMIESLKHVNQLKIGLNCLETLMFLETQNGSFPISRFKYLEINFECWARTPRLVFMNECASFFTHLKADNKILWFVLNKASVLEKIVIRASPECAPKAKRLRLLLKLRGFILASEEELHIVLEKLK